MLRLTSGRLLVATPVLRDPTFRRSVVLMLDHDAEGALGLILNRPSDAEVGDAVPEWRSFAPEPSVLFLGGPVEPQRAVGLARLRSDTSGSSASSPELLAAFDPLLGGGIGTLDLTADPDLVGGALDAVRIFAGYAGWGPGQLEAELLEGAWWVVDAEPDDAVATTPDDLWSRVLRRQPGSLRTFARYPDDPSVN
jgi:putative transcriptional regulator